MKKLENFQKKSKSSKKKEQALIFLRAKGKMKRIWFVILGKWSYKLLDWKKESKIFCFSYKIKITPSKS